MQPEQDHRSARSAAIRDMNYDAREKVLRVQFTSGAVYDYFDVPQRVYEEFVSAPSQGRFFASRLRDKFAYRKTGAPRLH